MTGDETTGGSRRALLIGVKNTRYLSEHPDLADRYPPLEIVDSDVKMVRAALEESGYTVAVECGEPGLGPVIGAVSKLFASCEPGDTALIYFSGHGETVNGRDHLVLADSQAEWPLPDGSAGLDPNTLLRADPGVLLRRLPPGVTAIVCLDICRTATAQQYVAEEAGGRLSDHDGYWLYSCGSGQRSYADPAAGSWFAQAFAQALSRVTPPTTFHEVVRYTEGELHRIADEYTQVEPPTVAKRSPWPTGDGEHRDPVICEGSEQTEEWTRVIRDSGLWEHTSGDPAAHERVKECLAELVRWVVDTSAGTAAHRDDPWSDPRYPARVEERLSALVGRAGLQRDELLSPAETACLLAAAVVQEGVVTIALDELRGLLPDGRIDVGPRGRDETSDDHRALVRDAARDVCRAHTQVVRTADTLRGRKLKEATAAADHWLRHRFIADWDRLWEWEHPGDYPAVDALIDLVAKAVKAAADSPAAGPRTEEQHQEIDRQVRQVLGHLTVKPDQSPRINDTAHGEGWITAKPVRGNQWRGEQLARLLWTAGLLAADPRRLSSVLVDHLGAHEPIVARQVAAALEGFDYETAEGRTAHTYGLAVRFNCPHPALHAALEELTFAADATVRAFRTHAGADPLMRGLPDQVTAAELRALPGRYKEPLERFRLAEDEIRPLLMGTQLYGDRMLAVRELYQNALDACRYRDMRRQYGRLRTDWDGTITFTQGWHDGRAYIECLDNGSGMTRTRLTSMFARAGKRFEQDPAFVQERRNWRREGISVRTMNSRFGIGVFSYFMLADEVVVWTKAVDRFGQAGTEPAQRADIQSGSGLLQINVSRDPEVPEDGGTRVRMYLAEPQEGEKHPSLVETLRSLLWVTEHRVTAEEFTPDRESVRRAGWVPGRLEPRDGWHGGPLEIGKDSDAWLVQGEGQLLLDGVVVRDAPKVYGRVINLRERHSPVPSVDRNQLLEYDEDLITAEVVTGVADAVGQCTDVSLPWLWRLTREAPRVAIAVLNALPPQTTAVLESESTKRFGARQVRLADTGCLPSDEQAMDTYNSVELDDERPQESRLFRDWQSTRLGLRQLQEDFSPVGYPSPIGLDALLFRAGVPNQWVSVIQAAAQAGTSLRLALRALRRYAITGIEVPAVADIPSLDAWVVDQPSADLHSAYRSLENYVRDLHEDKAPWFLRRSHELLRKRPPATHAPLLAVAALHDLPLGEVAEHLAELRRVDPALPAPPLLDSELAGRRVTTTEGARLTTPGGNHSSPWEYFGNWMSGAVGPVDLLSRSTPPLSPTELAHFVKQFQPLGFSLDSDPTDEARKSGSLPAEQQLLLSEDLGRQGPWYEGRIPLLHLLETAQQVDTTVGDVVERINAATPVSGAWAAEVPPTAADWQAPYWLTNLLRESDAYSTRPPIGPWTMVGCYRAWADDESDFPKALDALEACGLADTASVDRAAMERAVTVSDRLLFPFPNAGRITGSGSFLTFSGDFDEDGASLAYVMALAAFQGKELGVVFDDLTQVEKPLPLRIEPLPSETRELWATVEDVRTLGPTLDLLAEAPIRFRDALTIPDLLKHAERSRHPLADSVQHLATFAPLGAPAPPGLFLGPDAEFFADFTPTRFDHAAFDKGLLGPGILGALELVLVAGRFGWTLGRAYERYAPFRCLGLDVKVRPPDAEEAELRPDWQDVVLLSAELTGRAPALSGEVSGKHVRLCAEETGLDEAGVRERLDRYASLFELTVATPEDDAS
ncbi:caspase family protein [Streptomyces sp. NPDC088747]|uniref:HD domain-containing protein n=1 Tax=Streptomyces sp. NPDC088747 TaxID=3365886 RepID=UPI00380CC0DD